jgi:hypothetical protein
VASGLRDGMCPSRGARACSWPINAPREGGRMRSRPTGTAPTIDAHARQLPVLSLLSARHTTDNGHDTQDATLLVSR